MRGNMTREEAIDTLEMLRFPEPWEQKLSKRAEEVLDVAIGIIRECGESIVSPENSGEWIPISEDNLPEDFQKVLVTIKRYDSSRVVREAEYHENRTLGRKTFRVFATNERWEVGEEGLIAWMPKPEPYKAKN